jgi:hypothetical protein
MKKYKVVADFGVDYFVGVFIGYDSAIKKINSMKPMLYKTLQLIEVETGKVIVSYEK